MKKQDIIRIKLGFITTTEDNSVYILTEGGDKNV
jgi:hypothetical protein